MLFRTDNADVIAIPQPSHSWLSGQLVRAWGNEAFARPAPFEEVCLGAALHDIAERIPQHRQSCSEVPCST